MLKRKYEFTDLLIFVGAFWLLKEILSRPVGVRGISGAPYFRKVYQYVTDDGRFPFQEILQKMPYKDIGVIVRMIDKARSMDVLTSFYSQFKKDEISGEFKEGRFRILVLKIGENDFLALTAFIKKTNETPEYEKQYARKIIAEYKSGRGKII